MSAVTVEGWEGGFSRPGLHAGVDDSGYGEKYEEEVGENIEASEHHQRRKRFTAFRYRFSAMLKRS